MRRVSRTSLGDYLLLALVIGGAVWWVTERERQKLWPFDPRVTVQNPSADQQSLVLSSNASGYPAQACQYVAGASPFAANTSPVTAGVAERYAQTAATNTSTVATTPSVLTLTIENAVARGTETPQLSATPTPINYSMCVINTFFSGSALDFQTTNNLLKLYVDGRELTQISPADPFKKESFKAITLSDGPHEIQVKLFETPQAPASKAKVSESAVVKVNVSSPPFKVSHVDESMWSRSDTSHIIRLTFNNRIQVITNDELKKLVKLSRLKDGAEQLTDDAKTFVSIDSSRKVVQIELKDDIFQASYRIRITGGDNGLKDVGANNLQEQDDPDFPAKDFVYTVLAAGGSAPVSERRGITSASGPYVEFPDFVPPRKQFDGFNPEDKVETRVSRLYYYRDAHRVSQIINRRVKSYNKAGVERQRQLADAARRKADDVTEERRHLEREAVRSAQQSRAKERELAALQQAMQSNIANTAAMQSQLNNLNPTNDAEKIKNIQQVLDTYKANLTNLTNRANQMQGEIQNLRDIEAQKNEESQQKEGRERLAREEQFRLETAASKEDPDSYAPADIDSFDPVAQVSVSVIGEGLIHLRGPIKGINEIRKMIDEIDAPVGQVKVAIHTVQVNGEKADRMELVADRIQTHIDQARFLTLQASELLRKAVVIVASRKAEAAACMVDQMPHISNGVPTQYERDQRYLHAFFGSDFIHELQTLDSEFLRTGNKLLSLHSMDTTSLSSALTLMALAKNDTRLEILQEFERMCRTELPASEQNYIQSGMHCSCTKKGHGLKCKCKNPPLVMLGQNASFESLRGFFNSEITGAETMSPLQREFIRLAQIFKSRLITEIEIKQRVMERALIEQRLGNRLEELQKAKQNEDTANQALNDINQKLNDQHGEVEQVITNITALVENIFSAKVINDNNRLRSDLQPIIYEIQQAQKEKPAGDTTPVKIANKVKFRNNEISYRFYGRVKDDRKNKDEDKRTEADYNFFVSPVRAEENITWSSILNEIVEANTAEIKRITNHYSPHQRYRGINLVAATELKNLLQPFIDMRDNITPMQVPSDLIYKLYDQTVVIGKIHQEISAVKRDTEEQGNRVLAVLNDENQEYMKAFDAWVVYKHKISELQSWITNAEQAWGEISEQVKAANTGIIKLMELDRKRVLADKEVAKNRRPLDHKKFLDMLISETEDKYVELLEGTRGHTANIDAYIKRITTALDDDMNNQFYYPAFREIRNASTSWDVQFGQVETTSILANNRGFGKVSPQATMEFDLPHRDIVLTEAMNGAKGMIDTYGALVNDPSFLALSKMNAGGSTATAGAGSTGGLSTVRSVLPGLNGTTSEQILAQNGPGGSQFGSPLDKLIPDPAIYKFETGTGYEIRPVVQPDGQAVVFGFHYLYTTNVREPVRADEKHLGRVKRHFIDTDVQLSNYELREVSRYQVALKAARTSKGVPLFENVPVVGVLFRPLPSAESSLQQNQILAQATIFPTLFDLMGLRWAPAVSDLDALRLSTEEFVVRNRNRHVENRVYDVSSEQVDDFLRIPAANRRPDLYRPQDTIPDQHPNGYMGSGLNRTESQMREGYDPRQMHPESGFVPHSNPEGSQLLPRTSPPIEEIGPPSTLESSQFPPGADQLPPPVNPSQINQGSQNQRPVFNTKPVVRAVAAPKTSRSDSNALRPAAKSAPKTQLPNYFQK